jgi:hypothetical protein
MKESVILYQSQYDAVKDLSFEDKGRLLDAIFLFISGEDVSLPPALDLAFRFIRSQIERDQQKYNTIVEKRRMAGHFGGIERAKQMQANLANASKCKQIKQDQANQADNDNVSVNDNVTDNDNENVDINVSSIKAKRKRFTKPTIEEINSYIKEKGYQVDAQRFFDFYQSKGWYIGKNKMRDWRAAIRTWARTDRKTSSSSSASIMTDFSGDYSEKF